jgi:hypothetical protein
MAVNNYGLVTYDLDLVYVAQDFTFSCKNGNEISSAAFNIEVHCNEDASCTNTELGTYTWPLSATTQKVEAWHTPASNYEEWEIN